jgi:drug/metabolite transporter (DMT)-like permease
LALAAIAVTVVLWASAFVAIRHVGHILGGGPLALGRLLVGSAVLGTALLISRRRSPARFPMPRGWAWLQLILVGVLWFGVYNVALNEAERRVDAGTASMLVNIGPILIAVLAGLILREGFPRRLLTGMLVAFAGAAVIGFATSTGAASNPLGVVLCLVAAASYAVAVISQKPLLTRLPALEVTWLGCTIGALVCLPYAPSLVRELSAAPLSALGWVVYLGAMPTALAFTTWAYALARSSAGRLGATTYAVPPLVVLMSWLALHEAPPALTYVGGALCLGGVFIARRTRRRPASTVPPATEPQGLDQPTKESAASHDGRRSQPAGDLRP